MPRIRRLDKISSHGANPLALEALESRLLLNSHPIITEFMADNDSTLADVDGDFSDWIELHNPTGNPIDLEGWSLTDDADELEKWSLPEITLDPGAFLLVFASGKNRDDPLAELHTNFKLDADGEYLALVEPDGQTIAVEFEPKFPRQLPDIAYGLGSEISNLVDAPAPVKYHVPTDNSLDPAWKSLPFDDSVFTGGETVPSADVRITEVGSKGTDFVEFQNLAGQTIDTTGWKLAVNKAEPALAPTYNQLVSNDPGLVSYYRLSEDVTPFTATIEHGQALVDRSAIDGWHGTAIYNTPFDDNGAGGLGQVLSFSFYLNDGSAAGRQITPVLLEKVGADFVVHGIGQTRTVTSNGIQTFDFDVQSGSDTFDWTTNAFHMGVRYGSPTVSARGGVDYGAGASSWAFYGDPNPLGAQHNTVVGNPVTGPQSFASLPRDYSVQFAVQKAGGGGPGGISAIDETGINDGVYSQTSATGLVTGAIEGDVDTSVDFSGGFVTIPDHPSLDSAGSALTVEAWVQPDSIGSLQWIVAKDVSNDAVTPGLDYLLGINPDGRPRFITQGLIHDAIAADPIAADGQSWYHIVGVQDPVNSIVSLYVNGVLAATVPHSFTGVTSNGPLLIGDRSAGGGGQALNGRIDEVAIYDRTLTPAEITQHYQAGLGQLAGGVNNVNPTLWDLPGEILADEIIVTTEEPGEGYFGSDIEWNGDGSGWAMLLDQDNNIKDFVSWGYTREQLENLQVNIQGTNLTLGSHWTSAGIPIDPLPDNSYQRTGDSDTNTAADFVSIPNSLNATNDLLTAPFPTTQLPISGGIGYTRDGGGSTQVDPIGPEVIDRPTIDGASGSIFLLDNYPFTDAGTVTEWSFFANNPVANGRAITPLIIKLEGGTYQITGIGATRVNEGSGKQNYPFDLQQGNANVSAGNYFFGFMDGSNAGNNAGVIDWDNNTADTIRWFGGGHAGNLFDGRQLPASQIFPRTYSIQATIGNARENAILDDLIDINVESVLFNNATSLYTRYEFDAGQLADPDSLTLRIRHDDAFIAYLNGAEVARSINAPAVASYDQFATSDRPSADAAQFSELNITASAGLITPGQNVLAIHTFNDQIDSSEFLTEARLLASKFVGGTPRYFETSTPGLPNDESGFFGVVADTNFNVDRGVYDTPFNLEITSDTLDAQIYYTIDNSEPSPGNANAILYTGPVLIDGTTIVRAAAFKDGFQSTNVDTQSYIFIDDVVQQSNLSSAITNHAVWGSQLEDALLALPTVSISTTGPISEVERGISIELIHPDGADGFQVDAGVEHFGGHSLNFAKKNMRVSFKGIYGPTKLDHDLFGGGVDTFDQIILRSGSHDGAFYRHGNGTRGVFIRGRWAFDRQIERGYAAPRGQFVHVYINGEYWGQHNLMERPNADFMAENFGGEKEDYDALNKGQPIDGDLTRWNAMVAAVNDYDQLKQHLDVENYVEYMLHQFYYGNDWDWNHFQNWMAASAREGEPGYQFFSWDSDMILRTSPTSNVINRGGPGNLWGTISQHDEVKQILADKAQELFFNDGIFTPARAAASLEATASEIELSIIAENARWNINGYTPDTWRQNLDNIINNWLPTRHQTVVQQLRDANLLPQLNAPSFEVNDEPQHGGVIQPGDQLSISVQGAPIVIQTPLIETNSIINAYVPQNDNLGDDWQLATYTQGSNGETWITDENGVGYENGTGYENFINIDVGNEMSGVGGNNSVYIRMPFDIADQATIDLFETLVLNIAADDGFVAYLNGQRITSATAPDENTIDWNSNATSAGETNPNALTPFDVTQHIDKLLVGQNMLAIHGLNGSTGSSDMLILAEFFGGQIDPNPQPGSIFYTLDGTDPMDPNAIPYTGPITLMSNIDIRSRAFLNNEWSPLSQANFVVDQPSLRITELMFNPPDPTTAELAVDPSFDNDDFEFVEVLNTGSTPLNLADFSFTDGIQFTFPNLLIQPDQRILIVENQAAFEVRYDANSLVIAGQYSGALDNGGEHVTLTDPFGNIIHDFEYDDGRKWPIEADGHGASLEIIGTQADYSDADNWRASYEFDGTPGGLGIGAEVNLYLVPRIAPTTIQTSINQPLTDLPNIIGPDAEPDDFFVREATDYTVEIWLKSDQLTGTPGIITGGSALLEFDPTVSTALAIEFADAFSSNQSQNIDLISGEVTIAAENPATAIGDDEYALFARVLFSSQNSIDPVEQLFSPIDTGLDRDAPPYAFTINTLGPVPTNFQAKTPDIETRAVIYDFDNNNVVNFADLGLFLPAMNRIVGASEPPYAIWADFDQTGDVEQADLDLLLAAFGKPFSQIAIPDSARTESHDTPLDLLVGADLIREALPI